MATTFLVPKNRAFSKLAAAVNDSTTTFTVTAGEGANLPSTYPFHLTVEDEIVSVTNRSTDTLTVVRAQQSTSAAAHPNKAYIALNITAKSVTDLNTAVNTIEATVIGGEVLLADDKHVHLGTDSDITMLNRSTILGANTVLAGVLVGTPVTQAIAADSLMIANVTASGDIAMYVNKGGHSQMVLWADGSTGDTAIMAASGRSVDIYIAGVKVLDISNDATKTTLLGVSGDYIRVGDAQTTQHSLNSEDDLMVTGDLEVTGTTFLDGTLDMTPSAAANYHIRISGTDILNTNEQAIYINTPLETMATNSIWITLGSRVISGDLTGIRSRVTGNATSAGANVRGAYLEAKSGAGKYAAQLEGALIHADYSAGGATVSGDVRGLTVQISQGSGLNAANLYGILLNMQTRSDETITTEDIGLLIRNEAVGGNGRTMDAAIEIAGLNMGGGLAPFTYDIIFQNDTTLADDGTYLVISRGLAVGSVTETVVSCGLQVEDGVGNAVLWYPATKDFFLKTTNTGASGDRLKVDTSGNVTLYGTLTLAGKLTGAAHEIEGSNFDINGGTINGVTITSPTVVGTFDMGAASIVFATTAGSGGIFIRSTSGGVPGAKLRTEHISASPAINDEAAIWECAGRTSTGATTEYGIMRVLIADPTNATYEGILKWFIADNAGLNEALSLSGAGALWTDLNVATITLKLREQASAPADVAGEGQFWVKNDTPNNPYFTDDEGNDKQLAVFDADTGEMIVVSNQTATIETADTPHAFTGFSTGDVQDFSFVAGITGAITAYADYSGTVAGTILATCVGHGLVTNDIITIRGTTAPNNYNGIHQITRVDDDTFYFTDTWNADAGASDFEMGDYLLAGTGTTGEYDISWNSSVSEGGGAGSIVLFCPMVNTTIITKGASKRKFANNDVGSISGGAHVAISVADRIWFTHQSDGTNDLTINLMDFRLARLA